jgi:hypothetical protein
MQNATDYQVQMYVPLCINLLALMPPGTSQHDWGIQSFISLWVSDSHLGRTKVVVTQISLLFNHSFLTQFTMQVSLFPEDATALFPTVSQQPVCNLNMHLPESICLHTAKQPPFALRLQASCTSILRLWKSNYIVSFIFRGVVSVLRIYQWLSYPRIYQFL